MQQGYMPMKLPRCWAQGENTSLAFSWPQSLRTAVSICLESRFPILVWWGSELFMLYNDAYRRILGAKHPRALGQAGADCLPEIWGAISPMLEGVLIADSIAIMGSLDFVLGDVDR